MRVKKHYEEYWAKKKMEKFFEYERNWVLPKIFNKKEKILDLGCGDGVVAEFLEKELDNVVVGADISVEAVKAAKKRGVKTKVINIEAGLPFMRGEFDSVFWGDNIEHLFEPERILKEVGGVLKKKGRLILSCPNMGYIRYRLSYLMNGRLPDTEWTGNPPWKWSHIRFFNLAILKNFLKSGGFKVFSVYGINRRFPERYIVNFFPSLFAMILIVVARKDE